MALPCGLCSSGDGLYFLPLVGGGEDLRLLGLLDLLSARSTLRSFGGDLERLEP